ncbi:MAG: hypothetical protein ACKO26_16550 [Planctomycetota bacterium]
MDIMPASLDFIMKPLSQVKACFEQAGEVVIRGWGFHFSPPSGASLAGRANLEADLPMVRSLRADILR